MYINDEIRAMSLLLFDSLINEINDTEETIKRVVGKVSILFEGIDKDLLSNELRESLSTTITLHSMIKKEDKEHKPWLHNKKGTIKWKHWRRYERHLREKKKWPVNVIKSLDETTDRILELLEDPEEKNRTYDRRGLVVGYVQSGKTANFTGLINKAFDAGFKLVIVLAGMHNDLRSQTQMRLDEEVLGFETSKSQLRQPNDSTGKLIGVATLTGESFIDIANLTTRDHNGDFSRTIACGINVQPRVQPLLLVVKKNVSVLKNILQYFRTDSPLSRLATLDSPYKTVPNIPTLIIDDEADQASINTSEIYDDEGKLLDEYDPTKINGLIRQIYRTFEQKAYIGYTATPFANIFIHNETSTSDHGEDLFPKDFILNLPKPSNYVGPAEFFGLDLDDDSSLPLLREIEYVDTFAPLGHKITHVPKYLPNSLKEAIYSFILTVTIRSLRGYEKKHNSMLIHVTRFKPVQEIVYELVSDELYSIKNRLRLGESESSDSIISEIKYLFLNDFLSTTTKMEINCPEMKWELINEKLLQTVESIQVKKINGNSKDTLDYKEHEETGLNVIAVGGDKLSRGITLEGLSISYYLRASKMYDTLMQMGRWFGYRDGYLDLCRIYTTSDLITWFRHIAIATEELRSEIEYMASVGSTPQMFGLKVQKHPSMLVTNQLKMRATEVKTLSYSGTVSETTVFELNDDTFIHNFSVTDKFIKQLATPNKDYIFNKRAKVSTLEHLFWDNVAGEMVFNFIHEFKTASSSPRANSKYISEYINEQMKNGELVRWTVVLINEGEKELLLGGHWIGNGIERAGIKEYTKQGSVSVKRLLSKNHEFFDFTGEQIEYIKVHNLKDIEARKQLRNPEEGLLILYPIDYTKNENLVGVAQTPIGFGVVFPETNHPQTSVNYVVNNVFMEMDS
ncbi:Z1 domain-containing protein [Ammoniphilus sp. CFH 90114]|uniref:Z1 domain-containing protein n=1 Tax=Ammoniphilus sp. CFH 90114 TaxID=2493665 RepID=UPI00100DE97F|nr:Z1 domain-containing protein [Ammoniphilus sp. CFH 90114]RXT14887.1 endonuclease [Ammoniphilus sp. CFH 90114]